MSNEQTRGVGGSYSIDESGVRTLNERTKQIGEIADEQTAPTVDTAADEPEYLREE